MEILLAVALCVSCGLTLLAWQLSRRITEERRRALEAGTAASEAQAHAREAEIVAARAGQKSDAAEALLRTREAEISLAKQDANAKALEARQLSSDLAALRAASDKEREAFRDRMEELKALRAELSSAFAELSQKALSQNKDDFLKLAGERLAKLGQESAGELDKRRAAVEAMVKPLSENLVKVGERIEAFDKSRAESFARMDEQMKSLAAQEATLRTQTQGLAEALRKPSVRGSWGEMQLRRAVEFAGMVDKCHFAEQVAVSAADRPDMIVHLPNGLDIVVDSKAPMDAYLRATEAVDEESRKVLLADHARQLRDKIRQLSGKKYADQLDVTPEFTVLFLPSEALFSAALAADPEILDAAFKSGIVLATPTTLIALLMAVAKGWQDKAIADNALELKNECAALYDSVCVFLGHYSSVGAGLEKAIESYNKSAGSLSARVMPKLTRMNELGGFDKDGARRAKVEAGEISETKARALPEPGK